MKSISVTTLMTLRSLLKMFARDTLGHCAPLLEGLFLAQKGPEDLD
jgi:hypothetical protein